MSSLNNPPASKARQSDYGYWLKPFQTLKFRTISEQLVDDRSRLPPKTVVKIENALPVLS